MLRQLTFTPRKSRSVGSCIIFGSQQCFLTFVSSCLLHYVCRSIILQIWYSVAQSKTYNEIIKIYAHWVFVLYVSAAYGHLQATHFLRSLLHCALSQIVFIKAHRCYYSFLNSDAVGWFYRKIFFVSYILQRTHSNTRCTQLWEWHTQWDTKTAAI
jgi:hypothetical protein